MAYKFPHHPLSSNSKGQTCFGLAVTRLECTKGRLWLQKQSWLMWIQMADRAKSQGMRSAKDCWKCPPSPGSSRICQCSCQVACCSAHSNTLGRCHRTSPRSLDWKRRASNLRLHQYWQVSALEPTVKLKFRRRSWSSCRLWSTCLERLKRRLSQRIVRTGWRTGKCLQGSSQASIDT